MVEEPSGTHLNLLLNLWREERGEKMANEGERTSNTRNLWRM